MSELKTKPTSAKRQSLSRSHRAGTRRRDAVALAALMLNVTGMEPVMWGPSMAVLEELIREAFAAMLRTYPIPS